MRRRGGGGAVARKEEEKGRRRRGVGGQDQEARWVLQDPEVYSFTLLFIVGRYVTQGWIGWRRLCLRWPKAADSTAATLAAARLCGARAAHADGLFHLIMLVVGSSTAAQIFLGV